MRLSCAAAAIFAAMSASPVAAVDLDLTSEDSIKSAAKTIATTMVKYYPGDQPGGIPGLLGGQYYWWEAGGMFNTLINYWYYTGDDQFNDITTEALTFQVSPTYDYMPPNQTKSEGNDDQDFWGFAVLTAAEYKYPEPPPQYPSWLSIAEGVFNSQALRWDNETCSGGLRWQIFTFNNGYNYKNAPSNGGFINIAARLYAYTGNTTYAEWVVRAWDWMEFVQLISPEYNVWDGTDVLKNCSDQNHIQWSYSTGMLLNAAAIMWNVTQNSTWQDRANGLWKQASGVYFNKDKIMYESACEPGGNCNTDQLSFKAYTTRFFVASIKWAPFLYDQIMPYIQISAKAAAAQCSGGDDGVTCGTKWTENGVWDKSNGVGQQMCALEIVQANLINSSYWPLTHEAPGSSQGNATLGTTGDGGVTAAAILFDPVTTADRAGAGIVTALMLIGTLSGAYWVVS